MPTPRLIGTEPHGPDDAPLLVLGPSLGTSTRLWRDAAAELAANWRVVAWDLPGHGDSPAAEAPFTIQEIADGVIALVDALRDSGAVAEREFVYAGDSIGGAVGQALLLEHPDRVRAAALIATGARIGTPEAWSERAALVRAQGTAALVVPSAQRWFAPDSMAEQPEASGELLHALRDADDESYAKCCEALAAFDVRERLGEIAAPVLAAWGSHDAVTDESSLRAIAEGVQRGELVELPGTSHLPPAEKPTEVAALLDSFFARALAGGAR